MSDRADLESGNSHDDDETRMADAIKECLGEAITWSGLLFRSAKVRYATERDLLTGEGALKVGGRFNRKGSFPMVYASTDDATAAAEVRAYAQRLGWMTLLPRVLVGVEIRLHLVLDLTGTTPSLGRLGLTAEMIRQEQWQRVQDAGGEALTQVVGRLARDAGFEGLLVPSAQCEGSNLNYYPDRLRRDLGSMLKIINADELPRPVD